MNDVERALFEQVQNRNFQEAVSDDFSCVDSLIDQRDLDKINDEEEANSNGSDN